LQQLHILYPTAPIFTSVFDPSAVPEDLRTWDVRPSFLQRLPFIRRYSRATLPLMPLAFDRFDSDPYDVVISVSAAFAKNVRRPVSGSTICYCLTPPRYLWDLHDEYVNGRLDRPLLEMMAHWLRRADLAAVKRVDRFITNSETVAERVRRTYSRQATVIYSPVDCAWVRPDGLPPDDYYLVVSRLVRYKRIDLAIEACNKLKRRLRVVGSGPEIAKLQAKAGPTIEFLGQRDDAEVANLYTRCKAFLFPGFEDFGITPLEAQAAGRPVIAFGRGGATETVVDQVTGILFSEQSVEALIDAIEGLDRTSIAPTACRENAMRFDVSVFRQDMSAAVNAAVLGERYRDV
jgi:glycosyltransferase involved in cell wall biosynthesis